MTRSHPPAKSQSLTSRMPAIDVGKLNPAQQKVYDAISQGPRGAVRGPLAVWLSSPELADKAQNLGAFCRYGTSLPPRLSELAILVTGAHWQAGYEWFAHAPIGIAAGLSPVAVEAIRKGEPPTDLADDEQLVYAFAHEMWRDRRVSDATYQAAKAQLGETAVVELVGVLGYYTLISMTIVTFDVPLPAGTPEPFKDRSSKA
jgi:4-carboxymuconolactone decarboxylase